MRIIKLTRGYATKVDDEDYEELSKYRWHVCTMQGGPKAVRNVPRVKGERPGTIYMHRQIMKAPKGVLVDHVNHDTLDNRRIANLRVCTRSQNAANRKKTRGSSRFKGVYWDKPKKKWRAQILVSGHYRNLGRFVNEADAGCAYNVAALEAWGEFALLNDVPSPHVGGVQA
ncbi:hypothetical protein LCGC14_0275290 [marine sediment metagenome]|uniref:AP2/ERF domain-containing protein n=1 Tax=marine sediment metagenome TaxID=412755 RepID=A0A0F9U2B9_9ZZZZ